MFESMFGSIRERYEALPRGQTLRITAHLSSPVKALNDINLDNILAYAVIYESTRGAGLPKSTTNYDIPLPVLRVGSTAPIWMTSVLLPDVQHCYDAVYLHKRIHTGKFSLGRGRTKTLALSTVAGRWMERRSPTQTLITPRLTAYCVGNAVEIERLLTTYVPNIGGRRGAGLGSVVQWSVEPCDEVGVLVQSNTLTRPIPVETAQELGIRTEAQPTFEGYMPPYWSGVSKTQCYPRGAAVCTE